MANRTMGFIQVVVAAISIAVLSGLTFAQKGVESTTGAPLKGVDVKLGKNPGGSPAARTTNAEGKIDFGVLSAGSYSLIISAPKGNDVSKEPDAQIAIHGATGGTIRRHWNYAQKKAFDVTAD